MSPPRMSFRDGPKGRARNPRNTGLWEMDSGLTAARRPGMTNLGAKRGIDTWPRTLPEPHLAAGIGCLFDGIDQAVQLDRRREIRLTGIAADRPIADRPREQRVHLPDIAGFARRRARRGQREALRHRHRRQRVAALRAM